MKKIVILSVVASFALAGNVVNGLVVNEVSEVSDSSSFSNNATISQGQTDVKNSSNVEDVSITQNNDGNVIEDTTVSGTDSEVYQGLTSVDNSTLHHAELKSDNTISGVDIIGGKSTVTQANLIVGGVSTLSGTAGGSGHHHGHTLGDKIEIKEVNVLEDTNIENSDIHQGLTTLDNGATVLNTFKLEQENTINRVDSYGDNYGGINDVNLSTITQGLTTIDGGTTSNIEQNTQNDIDYVKTDGTTIHQSTINLENSIVNHINDNNPTSAKDEENAIEYVISNGITSSILQSSINAKNSTITNLQRNDHDNKKNNWIETLTLTDSKVEQSTFTADGVIGSTVTNVTYTILDDNDREAINDMYIVTATDNSNLKQDVTKIKDSTLQNSTINRVNLMTNLTASKSDVSQNGLSITNSVATNLQLNGHNSIGDWDEGSVLLTNTNFSQGNTIITD